MELDLPEVAPTPPTTPPAEEGGSVGFFPGLSLPHECKGLVEGPRNQVGEGSKLTMMPRRSPRRNYGILFFECSVMFREICLGWCTVVALFFF